MKTHIIERKDGTFVLELPLYSEWVQDYTGFTIFIHISEDQLEELSFDLKTYLLDRTIKKLGEPL